MSTLKVSTIAPLGTDATNTVSLQAGAKTSGFGKIAQIVQGSTTSATNIAVQVLVIQVYLRPSHHQAPQVKF